jgi:hypothetical protein
MLGSFVAGDCSFAMMPINVDAYMSCKQKCPLQMQLDKLVEVVNDISRLSAKKSGVSS